MITYKKIKMIYNYLCKEHGVFEAYSTLADRHNPKICKLCSEESEYVIAAPMVKLEGWSGTFPSAGHKWEKWHEKEGRQVPKEPFQL
jgi:hypothetical protein